MRKQNLVAWCITFAMLATTPLYSQTFTLQTGTGAEIGGNKDGGAVWADFDNDGDLDILINTNQNNAAGRTRLLQSDGATNPSFTDVTTTLASGLDDVLCERSIIWGDLNNDGNMDFVRNAHSRIEFYINRGTDSTPNYQFGVGTGQTPNFIFTDLQRDGCTGEGNDGINSEGLALLDYNNDGWLDLILENAQCGVDILENQQLDGAATRGVLLEDNGDSDGNSESAAEATGNDFMQHVSITGNTLGLELTGQNGDYMASGDYDGDGYVDFIVRKPSNATGYKLYTNDGDGTFTPNTTIPQNNAATNAVNGNKGGVIFCDFDLDGDLDIYWTDAGTNQVWLQTTSGTFTASAKPTIPGTPNIDGCACADVDADGDIDLFLGNNTGNSYLYINTTSGTNSVANLSFTRTDIAVNADSEGVNLVDYDDDGDYDIYVNVNGGNNQIWENDLCDGGGCDYLKVYTQDCVDGTTTTRPIVGATMIIKDDMGNIVSGAQSGSTSAGHGAQNPSVTIFSLPDMTSDYTIDITFPEKNGTIETYSYDFNAADIVDNSLTLISVNGTDGSSCDSFSVLPVELISFYSRVNENAIRLEWVTASELNNDRFEIERSFDGESFQTIGTVYGNGTTSDQIKYLFTDQNPAQGANYYRLVQYDYDGASENSATIIAFFEAKDELVIFPNPISDRINLFLGSQFSRTDISITISDLSGKKVWEKVLKAPESKLEISLDYLYPGIYSVQISNEAYTSRKRISVK
ncbi:FG-GAP-like repeat-containing protein [Ekhidna sp.]|uniref:FG-GAP-like repeat-containing protein n=1 Tax=Ekhidna sp. TaxID=2608089 RepID=UPI003299A3A2